MNTSDLTPQVEQMKEAFAAIEVNRALWQSETQDLLRSTLGRIKTESGLDLQVQHANENTNGEAFLLLFSISPSGIYTRTPTSMKSYIKRGGHITFAQAYNGKIFVLISFPYIEELVTQAPIKVLGKFDPQQINESLICELVSVFLAEMLAWETNGSVDSEVEEEARKEVGFIYGKGV